MTKETHLVPVQIVGLQPYTEAVTVFLKGEGPKVVPIVIGLSEAEALLMAIQKNKPSHPVAYDLLQNLLDHVQGSMRHLVIHSIREKTFYAYLVIDGKTKPIILDCRPSDGMVLAKRLNAPIYLTPEVIDQTGVESEEEK